MVCWKIGSCLAGMPRLFVRHTRVHAGSGHSVKAKPFGAASRATDEEASDGGPVKGSSQRRDTRATIQKQVPHFSQFSLISTRSGRHTCKAVPAYAPRNSSHTLLPPVRRSDAHGVMCIMPNLLWTGYRPHGFHMVIRLPSHTVFP